jgi:hypothetical protein
MASAFFQEALRQSSLIGGFASAYTDYYNELRTHLSLDKDSPGHRPIQRLGQINARPLKPRPILLDGPPSASASRASNARMTSWNRTRA